MIEGYATPSVTGGLSDRHPTVGHIRLGATGLTASQAGFGCYRIGTGAKSHEQALTLALLSGINLIDTSTNYADGGSEALVGQVLSDLVGSDQLSRQEVIIVSKAGYLQGANYTLSQERKQNGNPFPELVEYDQGLEHCIHPEFLEEQLDRSLDRLKLQTLDCCLLHNPEYYLGWAHKNSIAPEEARKQYYQRIRNAFEHLEKEAKRGRIRFYGISSNTFPAAVEDPEFTSLVTVWKIAESISADHRFRVIQLPFNLLETGAVLDKNQNKDRSVLEFATQKNIAVLINRPLNAFAGNQMIRLAEIGETRAAGENEIIRAIRAVSRSETRLLRKILPDLKLQPGLNVRIREQSAVGDGLKHYWRNFGSYERWRQVRDGNFRPRIQGVMDFLSARADHHPDLTQWIADHKQHLEAAYQAVGSTYAESAGVKLARIEQAVASADPEWKTAETISQKAFRAIRSTRGVSCVLVGMRKESYVRDVLEELKRPVSQKARGYAWEALRSATKAI